MPAELWLDFETFSPTPIKVGTYKYAELVEIMLCSHAIDDGPVSVVDFTAGESFPPEVEAAIDDPNVEVWFQNGTKFDWVVAEVAMPELCRRVPLERRRDTMVQAYSHSLPGGLEMLCDALGVAQDKRKLKTGKTFINLFCKPPAANLNRGRATRLTHPQEWADFKTYAGQDIVSMRECHRRMPTWNYKGKQLLYEQIDARINARGMCMDVDLAEAAIRASDIAKRGLAKRTLEATDGEVTAATQTDKLIAFMLARYGVDLPNMQKDTLERRIADESLPEELRELMRVRLQSTTTSVSKYTTLIKGVSSDGRLRGCKQFRGAARTGRVGHRLFQPGNMPRPDMKVSEIEFAIRLLKLDAAHLVFGNVMKVCSNAIRGTIIAPPGRKLVVADLANIEGRMAAWLAGEDWKLQAFRDYDTITGHDPVKDKPIRLGPDLYILSYAKSFNVPIDEVPEKGDERQIGKVQELMFQYGGGVGAWITGAATYGIDLDKMTEQVFDVLPEWARDEAAKFLQWLYSIQEEAHKKRRLKLDEQYNGGKLTDAEYHEKFEVLLARFEADKSKARYELAEKTFIACDAIKRLWRTAHPMISSYWRELEDTIKYCILNPGEQLNCRKLKIRRDGAWLRVGLPSGRALCYPNPKIDKDGSISYMGIHQYTKQWTRIKTYGGKVFENVTQAAACDQLVECQPMIEDAGFEIVLDVHDEDVTEVDADRDDLNPELLGQLMCSDLGWNAGLPLAAAGFQGPRYKKE